MSAEATAPATTAAPPTLFTPRPRALTLEESHRLVDIYIQDLLCGGRVDLNKLQHAKNFDIPLNPNNVYDVISKLLYYRFYRHNHYTQEINIALLLKMIHENYKFNLSQDINQLLAVCFSRVINNYAHAHITNLFDHESKDGGSGNDTSGNEIPRRSKQIIISYCEKLIRQYIEVFGAAPSITLTTQYTNLKRLETIDIQMYGVIAKHGFNDDARELFRQSWPIFVESYQPADPAAQLARVEKFLSELTPERCEQLLTELNPDKYDDMIKMVEAIQSKFVADDSGKSDANSKLEKS